MNNALKARTQHIRDHLRRLLAGSRNLPVHRQQLDVVGLGVPEALQVTERELQTGRQPIRSTQRAATD